MERSLNAGMADGEGKVEDSDRKGIVDGQQSLRRLRGLTSRGLCHESQHPEELFYSLHRMMICNRDCSLFTFSHKTSKTIYASTKRWLLKTVDLDQRKLVKLEMWSEINGTKPGKG